MCFVLCFCSAHSLISGNMVLCRFHSVVDDEDMFALYQDICSDPIKPTKGRKAAEKEVKSPYNICCSIIKLF